VKQLFFNQNMSADEVKNIGAAFYVKDKILEQLKDEDQSTSGKPNVVCISRDDLTTLFDGLGAMVREVE